MFNEQVQSTRVEQRERTRMSVIAAAQTLFRREGFRGTTIRGIAAEAGVSVGTVMGVGDKDALLLACYDRWIGQVHAAGDGNRAHDDGLAVPQRIGEVIAPFVSLFGGDLELAREYGSILARGTHRTEVFTSLAVALNDAFIGVYRDAGLGERAAAAGRATYLAYLGLLMSTSATGSDMSGFREQLEDVAAALMGADS
ncbi:TetR/AcrR family transcriptional regulator [Gordonia phthalatica]|uniref:HTH tetR-type domain-containing protein n=1 Tax=Gordonia phthalatica TaxID=1136941 RepID=A0A0N9MQF5_9ACTN|nr:TetR/AcrR family transcriptional regulator [Gordonia phthalatica]ALG84568.1 hypothetical protein ACH46_08755 [Gordonia phthalatica]